MDIIHCFACLTNDVLVIGFLLAPGLAPIFMKQGSKDSSKRPTPKLSAAEREAIQMRRNFLLSGVPVELKKIQNIQQSAWPLLDAPFPKHSHTYQDISADEGGNNGAIQPWCLPEVDLKLRGPSETLLPSVDVGTIHLGQLTSLSNDDKGIDADKIEVRCNSLDFLIVKSNASWSRTFVTLHMKR